MNDLSEQEQPLTRGFHRQRLMGRSADELIGICKGVLADGAVTAQEVQFLLSWMEVNADYVSQWPFDLLYQRLVTACADGEISGEEERELIGLLADMTGPGVQQAGGNAPNEVLCDDPSPAIEFKDRRFVLTGAFAIGKRSVVEQWIVKQGGQVVGAVNRKTDYVLLGSVGSRDWLYSTHGTKLLAAADLKTQGHHIAVIAERHALRSMQQE